MKVKRKTVALLSLALSLLFILPLHVPVMGEDVPPQNLIFNPGAESGPGLANWDGTSAIHTTNPPNVLQGTYAFVFNSTGALVPDQKLMTEPGISASLIDSTRSYSLSVWIKTSVVRQNSINLKFGASAYDADPTYSDFGSPGCFIIIPYKDLTGTYQKFEITCTGAQLLSGNPGSLMVGVIADSDDTLWTMAFFDNFELIEQTHTITATTPDNRGTITGNTSVPVGGNTTMTITPLSHCEIADVKVNGVSQGAISSYTFNNVTANQTIEATFNVLDENLIDNPGFEDDLIAWKPWAAGTLGTGANAHSGTGFYYISQFTAGRRLITDTPGISPALIDPARTYSLSVWIKASALKTESPSNIKFGASAYNAYPTYSGFGTADCFTVIPVKDITTAYQKYELTFTGTQLLAGNPSSLMVGMVFDVDDTAGPPYFYFDDFELIVQPPLDEYTITATTPDNRGTITGNTSVTAGGNATMTITPLSHCEIADVKVNGVSQGAISSYTFNNVTANQTIEATFTVIDENLIDNPGFEDLATSWRYSSGAVTTTATSHSGTKAAYMGGLANGRWLMTTEIAASLIDSARTYSISVWIKMSEAQPSSTVNLKFGASVYASATTYSGFGTADCVTIIPTNNLTIAYQKFEFTCTGAQLLTGSPSNLMLGVVADGALDFRVGSTTTQPFVYYDDFELIALPIPEYTITTSTDNRGTITGNTDVPEGGSTTMTITPLSHCEIADVKVNGVSQGAISSYTFNNVTANQTIEATFRVLTENLINNPGFENAQLDDWRISAGGARSTGPNAQSGTGFFFMGGLANGRWLMTDEIPATLIDPACEYRLSVWIKISTALPESTVNLKFGASAYAANTTYSAFSNIDGSTIVPVKDLTTAYQKLEFTCTGAQLLTGNPTDLMVGVIADGGWTGTPYVYYDNFELMENVPTVNMAIEHNYGGTVQGNTLIPKGSDATYTFHPLAGYYIYDVIVDGVSAGDVDHVSFQNVQAVHTIEVVFAKPANAYTHIDFEEPYLLQLSTRMQIVTGQGYDGQNTGMLHVPAGDYSSATFLNWNTVTTYSDPVFTIPVKPNTTYIWSARYKFSSATTTSYFTFYMDYGPTLLSRVMYADIEKDVWLQNEMHLTTGPDQTSISTTFNAGNFHGEFWIDDIELLEIPSGIMEATDQTYCEDIFNIIDPSEIKAQGSGSFILQIPVAAGVRYTFGATVSYTKSSDSYVALASDAIGTLVEASTSGAPSAKITPTDIGTAQRTGYVFMSDNSGYVYLVVNNDDGALEFKDLHLFQTYSFVTGAQMGYEEDPNDREAGEPSESDDPDDPNDPNDPDDPDESDDPSDSPATGVPATWPYAVIFAASALTVMASIKKRRVNQ